MCIRDSSVEAGGANFSAVPKVIEIEVEICSTPLVSRKIRVDQQHKYGARDGITVKSHPMGWVGPLAREAGRHSTRKRPRLPSPPTLDGRIATARETKSSGVLEHISRTVCLLASGGLPFAGAP